MTASMQTLSKKSGEVCTLTTLSVEDALSKRAIQGFKDAGFSLHKWHSNEKQLEGDQIADDSEQTYAKQQLGVTHDETKLLCLHWSKSKKQDCCHISDKVWRNNKARSFADTCIHL